MKTDFSVYASLLSSTPTDASNIASWLADREAAREAMKMDVGETIQDSARMAAGSEVYDENIAVAQIRILSKQYTTEPDVIPYVAVVDKWDDDMWLIVPFSPYKTPATPGEMETGLDTYGLHVLQAWNGRTVQEAILRKSYLFGDLSEKVRNNAIALFRHEFGGVSLPSDFSARRGSPIVEVTDPRREYLDECIKRLNPLAKAVIEMAERPPAAVREALAGMSFSPFTKSQAFERGYALAAADAIEPVTADCKIEGIDATIHVRYAPASGELNVRVFDLNGSRTNALDGWNVFGTGTRFLGSLQSADFSYKFQEPFDGVLILVDEDGGVHPLHSVTI